MGNYIKKDVNYDLITSTSTVMTDPGSPATEEVCYQFEVGFGYPKQILIGDTVNGILVTAENLMTIVAEPTYYETVEQCFGGEPATGPTYTTFTEGDMVANFNIGWNSGGESVADMYVGQYFKCRPAPDAVGIVTGVSSTDLIPGYGYDKIEFGLMFESGNFRVIESNNYITSRASFASGDTFEILVFDGYVVYCRNGVAFQTSNKNPRSNSLKADISMYSGGDTLFDAEIGPAYSYPATLSLFQTKSSTTGGTFSSNVASSFKTSETALDSGVGTGPAGTIYASATSAMVTGSSTYGYLDRTLPDIFSDFATSQTCQPLETFYSNSDTFFEPMRSQSSNYLYASSTPAFEELITELEASSYAPEIVVALGIITPMQSFAKGLTGTVTTSSDISFAVMDSVGGDGVYGESVVSFQPLNSFSYELREYNGIIDYMPITYELNAGGFESELVRANLKTPTFTLTAHGGGAAELLSPTPTLTVSGTLGSVGNFDRPSPRMYLAAASGTVGAIGEASNLVAPVMTLVALSGAGASLRAPQGYTVVASGTTGIVGNAVLTAPTLELTATGQRINIGTAQLLTPAPFMQYAVLRAEAPTMTLNAADQLVTSTTLSINKVFCVNKTLGEATEYSEYDALFTGTLNGKKLMINNAGINVIGGTMDNGALINSSAGFAVSDFGTSELKRLTGAYIGGEADGELSVTVRTAEDQTSTNDTDNMYTLSAGSRRFKAGKGIKSRYLGLTVNSVAGGAISVSSIEYLLGVMERRR